jgi:hypothetical protein
MSGLAESRSGEESAHRSPRLVQRIFRILFRFGFVVLAGVGLFQNSSFGRNPSWDRSITIGKVGTDEFVRMAKALVKDCDTIESFEPYDYALVCKEDGVWFSDGKQMNDPDVSGFFNTSEFWSFFYSPQNRPPNPYPKDCIHSDSSQEVSKIDSHLFLVKQRHFSWGGVCGIFN